MLELAMRRCEVPSRDEVKPDTPLRLNVATAMAFPDGSITASGLRREGARGPGASTPHAVRKILPG
jgi:hypothetical protein